MSRKDVQRFIKGLQDLSTLPALVGRIASVTTDENATTEDLQKLIAVDQALAQRVLRVANSVLFGHSGQIRDIPQAVLFLGFDRVKSIAVGMSVLHVLPAAGAFNVQNLWVHSYEVASLASLISSHTSITQPEECFLAGLLHDVGRVIFYAMDSGKFLSVTTADSMLEQEAAAFGCTHAEAGGWFAAQIGLPPETTATIRFHHRPSSVREGRDIASLVALAEALSRQLSPRVEDDGIWTPEHDAILLELSLAEADIRSLSERFREIRPEIESVFSGAG